MMPLMLRGEGRRYVGVARDGEVGALSRLDEFSEGTLAVEIWGGVDRVD